MDPSLMSKGRSPNKRLGCIRNSVHHLIHEARNTGEIFEVVSHSDIPHFHLEAWYKCCQVGIPCAFSHPIHCALHHRATRIHCSQRVSHCELLIIVAVNPQPCVRECFSDHRDRFRDLPGHAPAICVTHHQDVDPSLNSHPTDLERIGRVGHVPIKEVLQVQHHLPPFGFQIGHTLLHHREVLLSRYLKNLIHVKIPALPNNANRFCLGLQQHCNLLVLIALEVLPPGAPKGRDTVPRSGGQLQSGALKKLGVLGVAARPTPFDVMHPEFPQPTSNGQLPIHTHAHTFSLCSIS
mmetsp:Transcript_1298/g.1651  ORF Transcript_1298/g.1651 Transcript_1298/m.1651 type:complete len:294 (+) Transcript_1298:842-1723(+)